MLRRRRIYTLDADPGRPPLTVAAPDSRCRSTGQCNTLHWVDSAMLPRKNRLFGCTRAGGPLSMTVSVLSRDTWSVRAASSSFWLFLTRAIADSFISTKARCLNLAVESGSTNQLSTRHPACQFASPLVTGSPRPNHCSAESILAGRRLAHPPPAVAAVPASL